MSGGQRESWRPDPGPRERKRKGVPACVLEVESRREEKRRRNQKCSGEGVCPATFFHYCCGERRLSERDEAGVPFLPVYIYVRCTSWRLNCAQGS